MKYIIVRSLTAALSVVAGSSSLLASAQDVKPQVIATGLANPRGLTYAWGAVWVTEAGSGGDDASVTTERGEIRLGASGAVTRIAHGKQERVLSGLASTAQGVESSGPNDISFTGKKARLVIGLGATAEVRAGFGPGGATLGTVQEVSGLLDGEPSLRTVVDLAAFEAGANPDLGTGELAFDSNPFAITSFFGHSFVADAGGNDLLYISPSGETQALAAFPKREFPAPGAPEGSPPVAADAVTNAVAIGPDGALYSGELIGFPFPVGAARVYRLAIGGEPTIYAEGFTNIIALAFDHQGRLLVLEHARSGLLAAEDDPSGRLVRVANHEQETLLTSELTRPTGLAVGPEDEVYISNKGITAEGEVLRFDL